MVNTKDILKKYSAKIEAEMNGSETSQQGISEEYSQFKTDMLHENSRYEKWAQSLGNLINIKISEKDRIKTENALAEAHVNVTPSQAVTLSIFAMFVVFILTFLISMISFLITSSFPLLFFGLGVMASMAVFYLTYSMPSRLSQNWRLKASSEMVPAILYMVVYMKHTSNLERAIAFASQHMQGPLALDFKKIFYDVEIGKYSTIRQSLDNYLIKWKEYAPEFVEAIHLIESSLYEPSEQRRVEILEKGLQVILDGVYEKMLKYSREIRSPLTSVYMLGIILPTLGLSMIPLASTLLGDTLKSIHIFVVFNLIIPLLVFFLISEALIKRPGGYGDSSVIELNPKYSLFISKKPWITAILISLPLFIIGFLPFIFQLSIFPVHDFTLGELGIPFMEDMKLFDFRTVNGSLVGPFSPISIILSTCIPLAIAFIFVYVYRKKTKEIIKDRETTKVLEQEFTNSLFQLGNKLGDNIPAEIAFGKVAESTQGQATQNFFAIVNQNLQQAGMSLDSAIFDKRRGAITYFPSALIATSMRILIESVKKGLQVAARSLMSISDYVKNIEKINQRLHDLLAEVVSDMRSNMTFLAPLLAGIVVGLGAMITSVLSKLQTLSSITGNADAGSFSTLSSIMNIFKSSSMIPPYFLQIAVGIYIIEIGYILTKALVTIDAGKDPLKEKSELSSNLKSAILLYSITSILSTLALSILVTIALGSIG